MIQECFKYASSLLQVSIKYVLIWFNHGESRLQVCFRNAWSMLQVDLVVDLQEDLVLILVVYRLIDLLVNGPCGVHYGGHSG